MQSGRESLAKQVEKHPDVNLLFNDDSQYIFASNYTFAFPIPEDYRLNMILDPCRYGAYNCCVNVFGTPEYPSLIASTLEAAREIRIPQLAEEGEVAVNYNLIYEDWSALPATDIRTPDDYALLNPECVGRGDPHVYCMEKNYGFVQSPILPACMDHNSTVDATANCFDIYGNEAAFCVQVAYTQTAFIPQCNDDFDIRGDKSHCGTYIEVHQIHGTPYTHEDDIIGEAYVETRNVSGYYTITMPTTFRGDPQKVLCQYSESFFRVGSVVYVTDAAPVCCCPPNYNPLTRTGSFLCPRSLQGNGPYAAHFKTLNDIISLDDLLLKYPYCHSDLDEPDVMMCSVYESYNRAYYTTNCPIVNQTYLAPGVGEALRPVANTWGSLLLSGEKYADMCPYFEGCALTIDGGKCVPNDFVFKFIGQVGVITAIDDSEVNPIPIVSVTFNDGRSSYDFLQTHLKLEEYKSMYGKLSAYKHELNLYLFIIIVINFSLLFTIFLFFLFLELWWVLRTSSEFTVLKRKGFSVSAPECTFDSANNKYFPYAKINDDGTFQL